MAVDEDHPEAKGKRLSNGRIKKEMASGQGGKEYTCPKVNVGYSRQGFSSVEARRTGREENNKLLQLFIICGAKRESYNNVTSGDISWDIQRNTPFSGPSFGCCGLCRRLGSIDSRARSTKGSKDDEK